MRILIIDDEKSSHVALEMQLKRNHPNAKLVGNGFNVLQGIEIISKSAPDLVFLDIEMPDGTGFDLLQKFPELSFQVIFITAHNQYAQKAIRFGALDYLLKPIDSQELITALSRASKNLNKQISLNQLQLMMESFQLLQQKKRPERLAINTAEGIIYKHVKDIIRLQAKQNYTEFTFADSDKKLITSVNIGEYETQFSVYEELIRVHRSHIVNLDYIKQYSKSEGGYLIVGNKEQVPIARLKKAMLLEKLNKI